MIDLHSHILPGLDDGVRNDCEAVTTVKLALKQGITEIVATPHVIPGLYNNDRQLILQKVARLQQILDLNSVPVKILPGAEYYLEADLPEKLVNGELLTLNDCGHHLLVELPAHQIPQYIEKVIFDLQLNHITPVLAHPERNPVIVSKPEMLYHLVKKDILVQITSGSIVGLFGKKVKATAELFIRQHWVHFMASDMHGSDIRLSVIQDAVQKLARLLGQREANKIIFENPRLILGL